MVDFSINEHDQAVINETLKMKNMLDEGQDLSELSKICYRLAQSELT